MKKFCLVGLLIFPFLAFACGPCDKETPEEELRSSAEKILAAGASGDWEDFCDLLTEKSQQTLVSILRVQKDTPCLEAIEKRENLVGQRIKEQAKNTTVNKTAITKEGRGRINATFNDLKQVYFANLEEGSWRIDLFP